MVSDEEWGEISPHLMNGVEQIKRYREEKDCSLAEAKASGYGRQALAAYERITGARETNPDTLFHHRLSLFGPPCTVCNQLLRTPRARLCASCGAERFVTHD